MSSLDKTSFQKALKLTAPVALGYFPLGVAFGMLFSKLGYDWTFATVMSLAVYAGAAQFLAISLLTAHAELTTIFAATLILNLRHVFYGLPMARKYSMLPVMPRVFSIFALTDETYALTSHMGSSAPEQRVALAISLLNFFYWTSFCTLGAWLGQNMGKVPDGLEFSLVALFAVLLTERILTEKSPAVLMIALVSSGLAYGISGKNHFIVTALAIGCLLGLGGRRVIRER